MCYLGLMTCEKSCGFSSHSSFLCCYRARVYCCCVWLLSPLCQLTLKSKPPSPMSFIEPPTRRFVFPLTCRCLATKAHLRSSPASHPPSFSLSPSLCLCLPQLSYYSLSLEHTLSEACRRERSSPDSFVSLSFSGSLSRSLPTCILFPSPCLSVCVYPPSVTTH